MPDPTATPKPSAEILDLADFVFPAVDDPVSLPSRSATKRGPFFLGGPLSWAAAGARAHPQGLLLLLAIRTATRGRQDEAVLSREVWESAGLTLQPMRRALAALEAAGIVAVRRPPGCAPRVRLLPWPDLKWGRER